MQLRTVPNGMLEQLLSWTNRLPVPIAETFGAMMLARSVEAASNLGIFNFLGRNGPTHVFSICDALTLNTEVVSALLQALSRCGYLLEESDYYSNTAMTQRFLVVDSPTYVGNFIRYNNEQRMIWTALEPLARDRFGSLTLSGALKGMAEELSARVHEDFSGPANIHHTLKDREAWRNYMHGLKDLASLSTPELQMYLRFPNRIERLLDLGGGHAAYSIWMCRRYPQLKSTIMDLERPSEVGREIVAQAGLSDRIRFVTGDVTAVGDFGNGENDVVFCFNLMHHLPPDENVTLIRKAARSLRPGGALAILEEFQDASLKEDALARLVGVMFLLASGGNTLSFDQVSEWMRSEGLSPVRRNQVRSAPGLGLIRGWKV